MRRPNAAWDLLGLKRTMRALEDIRRECDRAIPVIASEAVELGWTSAELRAVRDLLERLGEYSELASQIEDAVDEEALTRRAEEDERKAAISGEMGDSAITRESEEVAKNLPVEGLWGEEQPWVIRPQWVLNLFLRHHGKYELILLALRSFSSSLAELHDSLISLRRKAAQLQHDLRERYKSPGLTLRNHVKFGAGVHIKVKDGVALFDADPAVHAVLRTNSTRLYVVKVRLPLVSPLVPLPDSICYSQEWSSLFRKIISTQDKIRDFEAQAMQVLVARVRRLQAHLVGVLRADSHWLNSCSSTM